jgi:putative ABC transport system ATP-binding protein
MGQEPIAQLFSVHKRYGERIVLREASLTIEAGELVSLVGRSGSGKSTVLHLIGGLDSRYEGRVEVLGCDLRRLDDRALSRLRNREVGFVFQAFHLLDHLTVQENVALPVYFHGDIIGKEVFNRVDEALDRVGLSEYRAARPGQLSGGQKQRVAIARALFGRPRLLLADEPTGNLDADTGDEVISLFRRLHEEGMTALIVTHEERVSRTAGRVLRLEAGRVEISA